MKERILAVMEHEGLTPSKFAEAIGIQRSAMSHIISGRNNPSLDVLIKILERFTYVDSDWLLFGKGTMMREHVLTEPNLFTNTTIIPSNVQDSPEYRKEIRVETPVNTTKQPVIEQIVCQDKPSRNVSKIMIFYSDNTFETFTPRKKQRLTQHCYIHLIHVSLYRN
ncbi:helix-turn-helix domain-containing protein [Parabacteroides goldsteinii]|uniref:helix-turn-helix domain-containing protein n=1 Tax=Parabacteroides goldsteinii TaxID=328812 RepID=UPI001AEAAB2A|nr:helix-turn-helix transcriptional regulator [Parabacteroides goldsteinii]